MTVRPIRPDDVPAVVGLVRELADYERALHYYTEASELHQAGPTLTLTSLNYRADALRSLKRGAEAERAYVAALQVARKLDSPLVGFNQGLYPVTDGKVSAGDAKTPITDPAKLRDAIRAALEAK